MLSQLSYSPELVLGVFRYDRGKMIIASGRWWA